MNRRNDESTARGYEYPKHKEMVGIHFKTTRLIDFRLNLVSFFTCSGSIKVVACRPNINIFTPCIE